VTGPGWLALAAGIGLLRSPAPSGTRLAVLAGAGRLGELDPAPGTQQEPPRPLPSRRLVAVLAGCAVLAVGAIAGPLLASAAGVICRLAWVLADDVQRHRRDQAAMSQLRVALRVLIGELDAGSRPATALGAAAEVAPVHAAVFAAAARAAADGDDAAQPLAAHPELRPIGLAWRLGESVGLEVGGVLTRVEHDLAGVDQQRRTVAISLAGPRASAVLLAGLPLVGLALGAAMGARPWTVLVGTPAGRVLALVGVLLDVGGVLWMRRILRGAQQL
jgi:tight adherence protein B